MLKLPIKRTNIVFHTSLGPSHIGEIPNWSDGIINVLTFEVRNKGVITNGYPTNAEFLAGTLTFFKLTVNASHNYQDVCTEVSMNISCPQGKGLEVSYDFIIDLLYITGHENYVRFMIRNPVLFDNGFRFDLCWLAFASGIHIRFESYNNMDISIINRSVDKSLLGLPHQFINGNKVKLKPISEVDSKKKNLWNLSLINRSPLYLKEVRLSA